MKLTRLALLGLLVASGCSSVPTAPDAMQPPAGHVLLFKAYAKGVQIYSCKPNPSDPAKFEWAFQAPQAALYDAAGAQIGTHSAGPTWEAPDGSKVVGVMKAKVDAPGSGKTPVAIPWLLLEVKSRSGRGLFEKVTHIQRRNTVGGVAPAQGCEKFNSGVETRVPYRADYYFYGLAQ